MKKGSRSRKCFMCGAIVMWWIPNGVDSFGLPQWKTKTLANYAPHDSRYCCKKCAAKLKGEKHGNRGAEESHHQV